MNYFQIISKSKKTLVKRIFAFLFFASFITNVSAQDITFTLGTFEGGYNISCHGQSNGSIDATIVGGTAPYTYSWSNGATTQDISGVAAGSYTLTVTDSLGSIATKSAVLYQPDLLSISLTPSLYVGYNISASGGNNGTIDVDVSGGAPPYTYAWSNTDSTEDIESLTAGTYSVVTTDQNGCTATGSSTLTQPSPLGYTITSHKDVKCFNGSDGEIKLSISGGISPYSFQWSNGSFTKNQLNIPAGTYTGIISDAAKVAHDTVVVIITQPADLTVTLTPSVYPNGYNVECIDCQNGSITSTISGGTSPFSYQWFGGQTTANLTNRDIEYNSLTVTDANSCTANASVFLSGPFGSAWDKSGNTGDSTKFIGTVNAAPVIFKSSGSERMRILSDGKLGVGTSNPLAKLDVNGDIRSTGSLTFGSDKPISYTPALGASGSIFAWGRTAIPIMPECFPSGVSATAKNQFTGLIELFDNSATPSSELVMGWDGANGIIDLSSNVSASALYLNHYCGKNVLICSGPTAGGGKVGIGTSSPTEKFDVGNGFAHFSYNTQTIPASSSNGGLTIGWNRSNGGAEVNLYNVFENTDPVNVPTTAFQFSQKTGATTFNNLLTIKSNGNVGIGTDLTSSTYDNTYKLAVNGKIRAKDVFVETGWSDFVFDENYSRMNLLEKENYYKKERHLPNIDAGKDIESNGLQVGKTMNGIMQNVEENTLDLVELYKKLLILEKENTELKQLLQKESSELKQRIINLESTK